MGSIIIIFSADLDKQELVINELGPNNVTDEDITIPIASTEEEVNFLKSLSREQIVKALKKVRARAMQQLRGNN